MLPSLNETALRETGDSRRPLPPSEYAAGQSSGLPGPAWDAKNQRLSALTTSQSCAGTAQTSCRRFHNKDRAPGHQGGKGPNRISARCGSTTSGQRSSTAHGSESRTWARWSRTYRARPRPPTLHRGHPPALRPPPGPRHRRILAGASLLVSLNSSHLRQPADFFDCFDYGASWDGVDHFNIAHRGRQNEVRHPAKRLLVRLQQLQDAFAVHIHAGQRSIRENRSEERRVGKE